MISIIPKKKIKLNWLCNSENHWLSGFYLIFYTIIFSLPILYIIYYYIYWIDCRLNFILIEILNLNLNIILFIIYYWGEELEFWFIRFEVIITNLFMHYYSV